MGKEEPPPEHLRCGWTRGKKWWCRQLKIPDFPYCENHRELLNIQNFKHKSSSLASRSVEEKVYKRTKEQPKHLPFDLFSHYILPRLPVKSLVRFTSVCKTWKSFIKSPEFIATHCKFNMSEPEGQSSLILNKKSCYVVENQVPVYMEKLGSISEYSIAINNYPPQSCNGLILLKVGIETDIDFLLWNPLIRKCKSVETSPLFKQNFDGSYPSFYNVRGLGFHDSSNDYRVVGIQYFRVERKIYAQVETYSLRTDSWNKVIDSNLSDGLVAFGGVFLNGFVHWLTTWKILVDAERCIESILFFYFENQCFGEMKLPEHFDYAGSRLVTFKEFQGSLAFVFFDYNDSKCFVWVMGEYGVRDSWNKKLTIMLPKNCGFPLGFTNNGMIVCDEYKPEDRPSRSSKKNIESTKKIRKKVPVFIFLDVEIFEEEPLKVIDYKESLALLM